MEFAKILSTIILGASIVFSALPLHKAVKIVKGKSSLLKTIFIIIITTLITLPIYSIFDAWATFVGSIAAIAIYRNAYRLKWHKAFFVWSLQISFIIISSFVTSIIVSFFTSLNLK